MNILTARKKPVVIETVQFTTNNEKDDAEMTDIVRWIHSHGGVASHDGTDIYIGTLEGTMCALVGDYIIRGVKNEFYPCKPDVFDLTYDIVDFKDFLEANQHAE